MVTSSKSKAPGNSSFTCDYTEFNSTACNGEDFYKEHNGKRYCVLHFPSEEKDVAFNEALKRKLDAEDYNFGGIWFPHKVVFSNYAFSKEANFVNATFNEGVDFTHASFMSGALFIRATFGAGAFFNEATFSAPAYFTFATFSAETDFYKAVFSAKADFSATKFSQEASFSLVTFSELADFQYATFQEEATFTGSTFNKGVDFINVTFKKDAGFAGTTFGARADFSDTSFYSSAIFFRAIFDKEAEFRETTFLTLAYFRETRFRDHVLFAINEKRSGFDGSTQLNLEFAEIEKPERVSFHTHTLRPHWFVNVDSRKFNFINVDWKGSIEQEFQDLKDKYEEQELTYEVVSTLRRLLALTYRQLAVNAEENHLYEEASRFRYWSMDMRRLESRLGLTPWRLSWWYWLASGYGERSFRALIVLLIVWLAFAVLYTQAGFAPRQMRHLGESNESVALRAEVGEPLAWSRATTYSLGVISLQKPDPRPATIWAQRLVTLETILGPLQAALLALAIRRKFMR
jgi:hypothetical protein